MLNIVEYDIVFQEVPTEVSLALTVAGCPLMCRGCSRADTWKKEQVRHSGLKTALYTGLDAIPSSLQAELTYLKTGPWVMELGGLDTPTTNQRFIDCTNGEVLNHLFWRNYE